MATDKLYPFSNIFNCFVFCVFRVVSVFLLFSESDYPYWEHKHTKLEKAGVPVLFRISSDIVSISMK